MLTSNEADTEGKERGTSQTEVVIEEKKKKDESGWKCGDMRVCVCVCVCVWFARSAMKSWGWDGEPEKRQNVWMHLRASGDKKGSWGSRGLLLGLLIPRPSHPFRACLRSGSLALSLRADDPAPPADLICCVFPLPRLPPPPPPSLSQSGTPASTASRSPAKGTFQGRVMSPDKACVCV